jgi:hypothetical protein
VGGGAAGGGTAGGGAAGGDATGGGAVGGGAAGGGAAGGGDADGGMCTLSGSLAGADPMCVACVGQYCCAQYNACFGNPHCTAYLSCLFGCIGASQACRDQCSMQYPGQEANYLAYGMCSMTNCSVCQN